MSSTSILTTSNTGKSKRVDDEVMEIMQQFEGASQQEHEETLRQLKSAKHKACGYIRRKKYLMNIQIIFYFQSKKNHTVPNILKLQGQQQINMLIVFRNCSRTVA